MRTILFPVFPAELIATISALVEAAVAESGGEARSSIVPVAPGADPDAPLGYTLIAVQGLSSEAPTVERGAPKLPSPTAALVIAVRRAEQEWLRAHPSILSPSTLARQCADAWDFSRLTPGP